MTEPKRSDTSQLVSYLANLTYEQLPEEVVSRAKASILNALGCGLGSSNASPRRKALAAFQDNLRHDEGISCRQASILGRAERTDVHTAALLNGIAITTADFDDTHLRTVIHPSGTPLAAILTWAESYRLSGKDMLLAFVVGVEAECAVGNAISPSHYANGWHITGTTGSFGAAAGIAKLMGLPSEQFEAALGHAASMAAGIFAAAGTDTKTLHMGRAAQNGIIAAKLAQKGFTSFPAPIEAWARLVSTTVDASQLSLKAKGGPWQILENAFKPYPCGIVIHPLIDGCLQAHAELFKKSSDGDDSHRETRSVADILQIDVTVNPQCVRLCNVRHPRSGLETIFSLYHACAVALVHGRAGPAEFSDEVASADPTVRSVRDKISVRTEEAVNDDEAWLRFTIRGEAGDSVPAKTFHVEHATGSLAKPMTQEELERKFLAQAEPCIGLVKAKEAVHACWNLDTEDDIQAFARLFAL